MNLKDYINYFDIQNEITCFDSVMNREFYFYRSDLFIDPLTEFPKCEEFRRYLVSHLSIKSIKQRGVTVNLYDLLNESEVIAFAKKYLYTKDQYCSDEYLIKLLFDDTLKNLTQGYEIFSAELLKAFVLTDKNRKIRLLQSEKSQLDEIEFEI